MSSQIYIHERDPIKFELLPDSDGSIKFRAGNHNDCLTAWISPAQLAQLVATVSAFTARPVVVAVSEAA